MNAESIAKHFQPNHCCLGARSACPSSCYSRRHIIPQIPAPGNSGLGKTQSTENAQRRRNTTSPGRRHCHRQNTQDRLAGDMVTDKTHKIAWQTALPQPKHTRSPGRRHCHSQNTQRRPAGGISTDKTHKIARQMASPRASPPGFSPGLLPLGFSPGLPPGLPRGFPPGFLFITDTYCCLTGDSGERTHGAR